MQKKAAINTMTSFTPVTCTEIGEAFRTFVSATSSTGSQRTFLFYDRDVMFKVLAAHKYHQQWNFTKGVYGTNSITFEQMIRSYMKSVFISCKKKLCSAWIEDGIRQGLVRSTEICNPLANVRYAIDG